MPSRVWNYFTRSNDKTKATCDLCKKVFEYKGTTSNLLNHLSGQHPTSTKEATPSKQGTVAPFLSTPKKLKVENEIITQAIADMVISDMVPLSIVEGTGFRNLMELVAPGYVVPSRKTVRARVQRRYNIEKDELMSELSNVTSASITTDTWTSNRTESYITVTEQHVSEDWEMQSNVLLTRAMPERHTGENLLRRLKDCVSEFKLTNKVEACVHDNARNMECAGNMCQDWGDLGCFAHTLQLTMKPALLLPEVSNLVSKCRRLVGHFKHSTTLTAEFIDRQKTMDNVPNRSLVQDVATRWNSTYDMMSRLLEQRRVVSDIMLDPKLTKKGDSELYLENSEWILLSELCAILAPFKSTTEYMCTERYVSVSEIYPIVNGLMNKCLVESADDSDTAAELKQLIHDDLESRYRPRSDTAASSLPALGALLDPRHKKLTFFTQAQRKITHALLEARLDELPLRMPVSQSEEYTPKRARKLEFVDYGSPDKSQVEDELQMYLCEKNQPDCEPLIWWKENQGRFPKVATVAKKVLGVPATSVPSERVFSCAGRLLNKLRNSLSSDFVDTVIFLNKNKVDLKTKSIALVG